MHLPFPFRLRLHLHHLQLWRLSTLTTYTLLSYWAAIEQPTLESHYLAHHFQSHVGAFSGLAADQSRIALGASQKVSCKRKTSQLIPYLPPSTPIYAIIRCEIQISFLQSSYSVSSCYLHQVSDKPYRLVGSLAMLAATCFCMPGPS